MKWKEKVEGDITHLNQVFQMIETRVKAHFSTMIRVDKKLDYRLAEVEAVSPRFNSEAGDRHSKS